ncbi:WD40 repeat-like protein [Rhizodiscina lignyota]|uniref:WD40 repeat-like protein n=1 Tax=Rhizodiscina lignyota TaxID=1504668 RepID=A0A9P4IB21_9PEZI|nr:WD40 repeat-like protein [Rhizodiscina lignyota]
MAQQRLRKRPAHTEGHTSLCYSPDGSKLVTAGQNSTIRIFQTGSDAEPANIDNCQVDNYAVVATDKYAITGSEDGSVSMYSLDEKSLEGILLRCTLPVRDLALSPNGEWIAVASDDNTVKMVQIEDMTQVVRLDDQTKPAKHVSFSPSGDMLSISYTDGVILCYSLGSVGPVLHKKLPGLVKALETTDEPTTRAYWHPDGRAFAVATATRDIQVFSRGDWERQRSFKNGHAADITAMAWSPNGALLASVGLDRKLVLWNSKTQKILKTYDGIHDTILGLAWHPSENILSYTSSNGELYIHTDFVPDEHLASLKLAVQPSPFIHDPLSETSGNSRREPANGLKDPMDVEMDDDIDPLDAILGPEELSEHGDGFIVDDDGAGYAEEAINGFGKRTNGHLADFDTRLLKRRPQINSWQPKIHQAFQSGSTPWRGNRKYLCLNLIGFVWTVDNSEGGREDEDYHTVTVEFYDREFQRDFHFREDKYYDKACLTEHGTIFSCPPDAARNMPATIYYRPHEMWTMRTEWYVELPKGESVTAMSLSDSYIVVTTSTNYTRVYSLFGVPVRIYRQKSSPSVTCASWRDYIMTVGNGPVAANGRPQLLYTIQNVKRDDVCQNEDIVALQDGEELKSVFFSDNGDPCIYDTSGTLLVLLHWRTPGQAQWVPLLDTRQLTRLADGKKDEIYWPVAVADNKFHCIILKGTEYPYFPRPLLTDFDFQIPVTASPVEPSKSLKEKSVEELEETFVRESIKSALLEDLVGSTKATSSQRQMLIRQETAVDAVLMYLLNVECQMGEERGMKCLEIVSLLRDRSGTMLDKAQAIAERKNMDVLAEKIRKLAESRMIGLVDDDD